MGTGSTRRGVGALETGLRAEAAGALGGPGAAALRCDGTKAGDGADGALGVIGVSS